MNRLVIPGHVYAGGAEVPFFVSLDQIKAGLEEKGFTGVHVVERDTAEPPIQIPPSGPWDVWAIGQWSGEQGELELPAAVAWVVDLGPPQAPEAVAGAVEVVRAPKCDPTPKPVAIAFRDTVLASFGGQDAGIARPCHVGAPSDHHRGLAWDWVPPSSAAAHAALDALLPRAGELALKYVIWEGHIWTPRGVLAGGDGWRPYTGPDPHTDHVHFSFVGGGAAALERPAPSPLALAGLAALGVGLGGALIQWARGGWPFVEWTPPRRRANPFYDADPYDPDPIVTVYDFKRMEDGWPRQLGCVVAPSMAAARRYAGAQGWNYDPSETTTWTARRSYAVRLCKGRIVDGGVRSGRG